MDRIAIVGTTGAGKTTLGRNIARRIKAPFTELDSINWQRNWVALSDEELAERVESVVLLDRWVIEGGYSRVTPMIWKRADTLIWIDYPFTIVLERLVRRTIRRVLHKEVLWSGNRESIGRTLSRESIILWLFKSYWGKRRKFQQMISSHEYSHLNVLHFTHPRQTEKWLSQVEPR